MRHANFLFTLILAVVLLNGIFGLQSPSRAETISYLNSGSMLGLFKKRPHDGRLIPATMFSSKPKVPDDYEFAQNVVPNNFVAFKISGDGLNPARFQKLDLTLLRKEGSSKTFENEEFSSIQFIRNSNNLFDKTNGDILYIVQAVHRTSGNAYYFIGSVRTPDSVQDVTTRGEVQEFTFFKINSRMMRTFEKRVRFNWSEYISSLSYGRIANPRIFFDGDDSEQPVSFIHGTTPMEINTRLSERLDGVSAGGGYLFQGEESVLEEMARPDITDQITRPICSYLSTGVASLVAAGGAEVFIADDGSCNFRSWVGSLEVQAFDLSDMACRPGSCEFSLYISCASQGAPLLEACGNMKDDFLREFGPESRLRASVKFTLRGEIEAFYRH
ncbi:hypothetical protein [uncultured Tateyamaria sp.]|uniref:hypothetical protein n=1 Tax=uncultured Tateyamaria sp. TaxID=455651 RepID=UPI002632C06D|nr:hypothetical protein [uncultured Tateyamaria sp.]